MSACQGAVILGLKQIRISDGIAKQGTSKRHRLSNVYLPTPWNHIEAGMAFMIGLPILIIHEDRVEGGVFDVGSTDRFVHQVNISNLSWLKSQEFIQPFNEWLKHVRQFRRGRMAPN
jgi:hypothetical protein